MARSVAFDIIANDRASATFDKVAASASGLSDKLSAAGAKMASAGKKMTEAITVPVVGAGVAAVKLATDFQASMEDIASQAGVPQSAIKGLSKGVLDLAGTVGTAPGNLADALYHIESSFASTGITGKQAMNLLKIAAEGAKVGQADLVDVTNALDAAVVSNIKGVQNQSQAMGVLNAVVGSGDMKMQDLADALGTGILASAKTFGLSITDVGAALATFGDNNIRGTDAATKLRQALSLMAAPSGPAAAALASIGIGATELADDMQKPNGLLVALKDLKTHLDNSKLSASQQAQVLSAAFGGGRTSSAIMILLSQMDRLQSKYGDITKGAQQFGSDWAKTTDTAKFKFDQAIASLEAAGITLGNKILPIVSTVAETISGLIDKFSNVPDKIQTEALIAGGFLAAVGPIVYVTGKVTTLVGQLKSAWDWLGKLLGKVTGAGGGAAGGAISTAPLDANTAALNRLTAAIETKGIGGVAGTGAGTAAGGGAGAAAGAGGALARVGGLAGLTRIAGLAGLAAGAVYAVGKAFQWLEGATSGPLNTVIQLWQRMTSIFTAVPFESIVADFEHPISTIENHFLEMWHVIDTAWHGIETGALAVVAFFEGLPGQIVGALSSLGGAIVAALSSLGGAIVGFFVALPGRILAALATAGNWLVQTGVDVIVGLLTGLVIGAIEVGLFFYHLPGQILSLVVAAPGWLFNTGMLIIQGLINGIYAVVGAVWTFYSSTLPGTIWSLVSTAGTWLLNTGIALIQGLLSGIAAVVGTLWNFFIQLPGQILSLVVAAPGWLFNTGSAIIQGLLAGITAVVGWVWNFYSNTLPQTIWSLVASAGTWLYNTGGDIIQGLLNGIWAAMKGIGNWIKDNIIDPVINNVKHFFGISSPSTVFQEIGSNMIQGLLKGLLSTDAGGLILKVFGSWPSALAQLVKGGLADVAKLPGDALSAISSALGALFGTGGGGAATGGIVAMMQAMNAARGWSGFWSALYNLEMREAGFNMTARNPSSGAYGLAQFIQGPSGYAAYGGNANTPQGQITAMLNYIAQRYGNPGAAWAHEISAGWYDAGGWLPTGVSMAVNRTGRAEPVGFDYDEMAAAIKRGGGSGPAVGTMNNYIQQPVDWDAALNNLEFRTKAGRL